jgi:inorganic phosphate transporter, PiT family
VAGNIVGAWILTLPAAGLVGAIVYGVSNLFGSGATGPVVIAVMLLLALVAVFARRVQLATPAPVST